MRIQKSPDTCGRGLRKFASRLRAENVNVCFEVGHVTGNVKYIRKSVFQHQNVEGGFFPPIFVICFFWGGGWGLRTLLLPLLRRLYKGCFEIRILCKFLYLELGTVQKFLALCILQFSFISVPLSIGEYSSAICYDHWKTKPWASLL